MKTFKDFDFKNKIVFLRVDLNVPVKEGKILDYTRIEKIVPTINYLLKKKAKIVLASHFGRPKNGIEEKYSLNFMARELENILGQSVLFTDINKLQNLNNSPAKILLLENLRFYPGETENSAEFAQKLASFANVYVNDAFSCCHRAHASIVKITQFLPSAAGLLLQEELDNLNFYLEHPNKPLAAIIGGSKVSTKLDLLDRLSLICDHLIVGGAMANTFLRAKGYDIGSSFFEPDLVEKAKEILLSAKCNIIIPEDFVTAKEISDRANTRIASLESPLNQDEMILDIGPQTISKIFKILEDSATVIMNGPLGVFEYSPFKHGSFAVAKKVAELTQLNNLHSIAGGGDIVAAITQADLFNQFSYISTAGGAFLEWLEGKALPGLKALES